jgi:hypothetical protein
MSNAPSHFWLRDLKVGGRATGVTVRGGLKFLRGGRNFFFLPRPQLNHVHMLSMSSINISTPAQLSAYANHELKN